MDQQMGMQLSGQSGGLFLVSVIVLAVFFSLIVAALKVLITCKIFGKAGYHWALGFLILVPIVNIIIPFYLAFADWPVHKELRASRQRLGEAPS